VEYVGEDCQNDHNCYCETNNQGMPFESPQETVFLRAHDSPHEKNDFSQHVSSILYYKKDSPLSTTEKADSLETRAIGQILLHFPVFLGSLFFSVYADIIWTDPQPEDSATKPFSTVNEKRRLCNGKGSNRER
jgi:hypothetical protein